MKRKSGIIVAGVIVVLILAIAFFAGDKQSDVVDQISSETTASEKLQEITTEEPEAEQKDDDKEKESFEPNEEKKENIPSQSPAPEEKITNVPKKEKLNATLAPKENQNEDLSVESQSEETEKEKSTYSEENEPADNIEKDFTCTLSVRCDAILDNVDKLADGKKSVIPADGVILGKRTVTFSDGESVFDVLYRELKNNNIHFEYVKNPMYDSAYIEGIGNIYEFDCGDLSGWTYKVNNTKPTYGCSQYKLKKGDVIEFIYSCNFMED